MSANDLSPNLENEEKLQFSLSQLLLTVTVCAVLLALFRALDTYGVLLAFFAAVGFCIFLGDRKHSLRYLVFDFIWGVFLPVVCLLFDPYVFSSADFELQSFQSLLDNRSISSLSILAYAALGYQMLLLSIWLLWGQKTEKLSAFFSGSLAVGFLLAMTIGILMLPITIIGLTIFIGVLGFTPFFTARAFFRRMRQAAKRGLAAQSTGRFALLFFLGSLAAVVLPVLAWLSTGVAERTLPEILF